MNAQEWLAERTIWGKVYTELRMNDDAKKAFQAALDFQKRSPEVSNDYAEEARAVLGRL